MVASHAENTRKWFRGIKNKVRAKTESNMKILRHDAYQAVGYRASHAAPFKMSARKADSKSIGNTV